MDRIFEFVGSLLMKMGEQEQSLGWAVFLFTACVTLIMLISIVSEIRSLQLAEYIRPLHEGILEKLQHSPDEMGKALIKLHRDFGYHTLLNLSGNIVHVIVVALLAGTFWSAEKYLPAFGVEARQLLWIRDLSLSPLNLILQGKFYPDLLLAALGLLVMDYLVSFNVRFSIRRSLMSVESVYKCITGIILAAAFFLPQAVMAYFAIYYFLKNIILLLYLRFMPYKLSLSQQVIYGEYEKKLKGKKFANR